MASGFPSSNFYFYGVADRDAKRCALNGPAAPPVLQAKKRMVAIAGEPHGFDYVMNPDGSYSRNHVFEWQNYISKDEDGDGIKDLVKLVDDRTIRNGQYSGIKMTANLQPGALLNGQPTTYIKDLNLDVPNGQVQFKADKVLDENGKPVIIEGIDGLPAEKHEVSAYIGGKKVDLKPGEEKILYTETIPDPRRRNGTITLEYKIKRDQEGNFEVVSPEKSFNVKIDPAFGGFGDVLNVENFRETEIADPLNVGKTFHLTNDQIGSGILDRWLDDDNLFNNIHQNGGPDKHFQDFFGDIKQYIDYSQNR